MNFLKGIVLGFIAGAISALTVHEFISWLFSNPDLWVGWDRLSWSKEPVNNILLPDVAIPQIISTMIWGGLWGALFGVILGPRPQGSMTIQGAILGLFGPALIGVLVAVPLLTQKYPIFYDGDAGKVIPVLAIMAGFGAATAWLYGMFRYGRLP
ncbi:MAG TPA: hypothetical protein PLD46_05870 [Hyphomicrobium sp.]|nr:hypothetical protein [Hyphomicrobium sp.]